MTIHASLRPPLAATIEDLPPAVAAVLDAPPEPELGEVEANGLRYGTRTWLSPGRADEPAVVLIHGVTSTSRTFWRLGPALAAGLERTVVAIDQAGHGRTRGWLGHHLHRDNAADIGRVLRAAGLDRPGMRVLGHSWGGMTVAWLPAAGFVPDVTVLFDPPALPRASIATMLDDPIERWYPPDQLETAITAIAGLYPTWPWGDVLAKSESLTQFDPEAVRSVLLGNGDWDGGLEGLAQPEAREAVVRLVRGDPAFGGLIPDAAAEAFAERLGPDNVTTIARGSHSPMRQRPEATTLALLRAFEPPSAPPGA
jgi:pimeloyl-ACP methyl ester carboxylesterase